jgi:hypothetical protein
LTQAIDESQQVTLKGSVHGLATPANDRGAVDDGVALDRVQVMLKRSPAQETALHQLIQDMHTPGTASYHKWLTPAQFGEQFGPSDTDIATITAWLGSHGFTVTKVNPGKQTLEFSGSAGQFRKTFHTEIHKYAVNGQMHTANAGDPSIPAALAPVFGGFTTLNNFQPISHAKRLGSATFNPATHETKPDWTQISGNYTSLILAPGDFAVQYNVNPLYTAGTTGTGQTIAIINEANISIALVNQYRTLFGLPANPPTVIIDGNDPGIDGVNNPDGPNGASGEAYIDVEQSGAIAPNATIDLVIAADTTLNTGLYLAAEHAVYNNVAPVLSVSFGLCEGYVGASTNAFLNGLMEQAAAQGQTVLVSTGDAGSASCDQDEEYAVEGQTVSGFASTPYDVAVGGTDFYYSSYSGGTGTMIDQAEQAQLATYWSLTPSNNTPMVSISSKAAPIPEQPWNDSQYGLNLSNVYLLDGSTSTAAGSGGASNCATGVPLGNGATGGTCQGYPKPAWQSGTGVPADGVRDLPDVSLFAANGVNLSFYPFCASDGDCQPVGVGDVVQISGYGGTSVSTPAFAAIMALVNQKYGRQGQADYVLYKLAAQFPTAFNDVTVGTNTVPCAAGSTNCIAVTNPLTIVTSSGYSVTEGEIGTGTTAEYNATAGYDLATGLGSVNAANLVADWNSVTSTATSTTLTLSAAPYTSNTAVTVSGTVSGATSGNVELMTTSSEPLQAGQGTFAVTSTGTYSGTVYLPGGTYTVYASYGGNGTSAPSSSTPQTITVAQSASKVTLTALNELGSVAATSGASTTYGTQLLLTATPAPSSSASGATATGTVTFTDSGTVIGTEPVSAGGTAVLNWAPLVGSHSVTASYSGDSSYAASTSSAFALTVTKNLPDLAFGASAYAGNSDALAGTTTLTVQVSNSGTDAITNNIGYAAASPVIAPTGVVTITGFGSTTLTFPSLQAGLEALQGSGGPGATMGTAALTIPSTIPPGTYNLTMSYPGDSNYLSTSIVEQGYVLATTGGTATTTTATASAAQTSRTAAVVISGTVTGASNQGVPTGTVIAESDGYEVGVYTLGAGSGASAPYSIVVDNDALTPGVNVVTLQYLGSSTYAPSVATVTVGNGSTAFYTLTNSGAIGVNPGSDGMSTITITPVGGFTGAVALSCAVTPVAASSAPTCTIASSASVSGLSPVTVPLSLATLSTTTTGTYVVTVTGTNNGQVFTTSVPVTVSTSIAPNPQVTLTNSGSITLPATGGSGTSTITLSPSGGFSGPVALTCTVAPSGGPTCSVTSPVTLTAATAGTATLTVTSTSATTSGAYTVTVTSTGTGIANATTAVPVTVSSPNPTVVLSDSGGITVAAGATTGNTSTITVTPGGGFSGAVSLTCAVSSSVSEAPTCSITSPVTISGTTAGTATLTVSTTAASAELQMPRMRLLPIGGGIAAAALLFFLVPMRRRRISTLLGALVLIAVVGFSAGCGGGGSAPPSGNQGTPAGTYTVTVSGTATGVTITPITVSVTVN